MRVFRRWLSPGDSGPPAGSATGGRASGDGQDDELEDVEDDEEEMTATLTPDTSRRLQALRRKDILDGLSPEKKAEVLANLTSNPKK